MTRCLIVMSVCGGVATFGVRALLRHFEITGGRVVGKAMVTWIDDDPNRAAVLADEKRVAPLSLYKRWPDALFQLLSDHASVLIGYGFGMLEHGPVMLEPDDGEERHKAINAVVEALPLAVVEMLWDNLREWWLEEALLIPKADNGKRFACQAKCLTRAVSTLSPVHSSTQRSCTTVKALPLAIRANWFLHPLTTVRGGLCA